VIVDSSALVAMLRGEAGADDLSRSIAVAGGGSVPAPCYLETCMVMAGRKGPDSRPVVEELLATLGLGVMPFAAEHARVATEAFLRFGKGRHPAGLNFGDCMAYAVAQAAGAPLLFTGGDFGLTDVEAAIPAEPAP
jgi:ribonuclease VapC